MKFTLSHGVHNAEFSFESDDPGYEEIVHRVRTAMNQMDALMAMPTTEQSLRTVFPLPSGVSFAGYYLDMREVFAYRIERDDFIARYDWLEDGVKMTWTSPPIVGINVITNPEISVQARAQVRAFRGISA